MGGEKVYRHTKPGVYITYSRKESRARLSLPRRQRRLYFLSSAGESGLVSREIARDAPAAADLDEARDPDRCVFTLLWLERGTSSRIGPCLRFFFFFRRSFDAGAVEREIWVVRSCVNCESFNDSYAIIVICL